MRSGNDLIVGQSYPVLEIVNVQAPHVMTIRLRRGDLVRLRLTDVEAIGDPLLDSEAILLTERLREWLADGRPLGVEVTHVPGGNEVWGVLRAAPMVSHNEYLVRAGLVAGTRPEWQAGGRKLYPVAAREGLLDEEGLPENLSYVQGGLLVLALVAALVPLLVLAWWTSAWGSKEFAAAAATLYFDVSYSTALTIVTWLILNSSWLHFVIFIVGVLIIMGVYGEDHDVTEGPILPFIGYGMLMLVSFCSLLLTAGSIGGQVVLVYMYNATADSWLLQWRPDLEQSRDEIFNATWEVFFNHHADITQPGFRVDILLSLDIPFSGAGFQLIEPTMLWYFIACLGILWAVSAAGLLALVGLGGLVNRYTDGYWEWAWGRIFDR